MSTVFTRHNERKSLFQLEQKRSWIICFYFQKLYFMLQKLSFNYENFDFEFLFSKRLWCLAIWNKTTRWTRVKLTQMGFHIGAASQPIELTPKKYQPITGWPDDVRLIFQFVVIGQLGPNGQNAKNFQSIQEWKFPHERGNANATIVQFTVGLFLLLTSVVIGCWSISLRIFCYSAKTWKVERQSSGTFVHLMIHVPLKHG